MPLFTTEEQKKAFIRYKGLDPLAYDLDENTLSFIPRSQSPTPSSVGQPSTDPTDATTQLQKTPSGLESFGRSAAESAVPTAASLGTIAGLSWLAGPGAGIPTTIAALLAGAGAGIGASALQRQVVPEDIQQKLFTRPEDIEANKWATIAGGFAPSALAFNPAAGIRDLPALGRGLAKLPQSIAQRTTIPITEKIALMNAAANVVPQAGISAYNQLSSDQPFDVGQLLGESLPGVLFTRPTGLGRALKFKAPPSEAELRAAFETQPSEVIAPTAERQPTVEEILSAGGAPFRDVTAAGTTPEGVPGRKGQPRSYKGMRGVARMEKESYGLPGLKLRDEPTLEQRAIERMEAEGGPAPREVEQRTTKLEEQLVQAREEMEVRNIELQAAARKFDERMKRLEQEIGGPKPPLPSPKSSYTEEVLARPSPEAKRVEDIKARFRSSDEPDLRASLQTDINALSPEQRIRLDTHLRSQATRRGFKVREVPEIQTSEGKSIAGNIDLERRVIQLSKLKGEVETPAHEAAGHGFLNDMLRSTRAADQRLGIRALDAYAGKTGRKFKTPEEWFNYVKESPEDAYRAATSVEETLAKDLALEGVKQSKVGLYGTKYERLKSWLKGAKSAWKEEFGLATPEDLRTHLIQRYRGDAPYGTRLELAPQQTKGKVVIPDAQEEKQTAETEGILKEGVRESAGGEEPQQTPSRINEKQDELLRNFYKAANQVAGRTSYGRRSGVTEVPMYKASWSNASRRWDINANKVKKGTDVTLDANEIFVRASSLKDAQLIASNLPDLPLDVYSAEKSPLQQIGKTNKSSEKIIQELAEFWKQEPKSPDVTAATERFMEKLRSPEQRYSEEADLPKPPIVRLATSTLKNPLGDPMGTTYRATLEDWARWQQIQSEFKRLMNEGKSLGDPEMKALWNENESIKNKYGGMPPVAPETTIRESSTADIMRGMEEQLQTAAMKKWKTVEGKEKVPKRAANELVHNIGNDVYNLVADKHPEFSPQDSWSVAEHLMGRHGEDGKEKAENWLLDSIGQERLDELNTKIYREMLTTEQRLNENKRNLREAKKEAQQKTEELEAFTRPDVERQSEEGQLQTKVQEESIKYPSSFSFNRLLTARLDKVAEKINTPTAREVTYKLRQANTERDILEGRVGNRLIAQMEGYSHEEIQRVRQYRHEIDNNFPEPFNLTPREETLKTELDKTYKEIGQLVIDSGLQVRTGDAYRKMQLKPEGYQENMPSARVMDAWIESKPEAAEYDRLYIEHAMKKGESAESAQKILDEYKQYVGNVGITPDIRFGAIRKAEGIGLPWELVEQNGMLSARRYGRRVASDLAFFKYIQNDPRMLKALGIKDQFGKTYETSDIAKGKDLSDISYIGSSPEVVAAKRSLYGIDVPQNPAAQTAARVVGANIMQTGTAIRNIAALPTSIAPYYGVNLRTVMTAISKMNERVQRAFENNAIRKSFKDFDAAGELEGNPNKFIKIADDYVGFMRKWTGRDASDKFEGLFSYSLGEEMATKWFAQAKAGDIKARAMLNRFGTTVEGGVKKKFLQAGAEITPDDISRVAKEFTDVVRGSYSAAGLPSVAIEGPLAPFLSLSRWSLERANNFYKDAILPIKETGDWMPLLKTSFAAILSGAAIEKINEALSGKRGSDPTITEAITSGSKEALIAKGIGLAQLGALGGIASDAMKFGSNLYQGKDLKFATPISFPLASVTEDLAQKTSFMVQAIREGEDPFEVLGEYMKEVIRAQSQNARYVQARISEETARKEKFRDLRVFEELSGSPRPTDTGTANPFMNLKGKEFKKTADLDRAAELLPEVLDDVIVKSGGDYEKLKKLLTGLKSNNYQIFPSPDSVPQTAQKFYDFLVQTQGQDEADRRFSEFLEMRMKNKIKASVVPSL